MTGTATTPGNGSAGFSKWRGHAIAFIAGVFITGTILSLSSLKPSSIDETIAVHLPGRSNGKADGIGQTTQPSIVMSRTLAQATERPEAPEPLGGNEAYKEEDRNTQSRVTSDDAKTSTLLRGAPVMDRMLEREVTLDLDYKLHIDASVFAVKKEHSYDSVMKAMHGENIWQDEQLQGFIQHIGAVTSKQDLYGSTLQGNILETLVRRLRPKILLEVGVFRGSTSISMAKLLDDIPGLEDSFVISMDTWLLDLRFVWRSSPAQKVETSRYFKNLYIGGGSHMYYLFLSNVIMTKTTERIIPLATASQNGAMALIAHGIRPQLIYVDASHANPDVFLDLENFYNILAPGGAMAMDDYDVPAVKSAIDALVQRYALELQVAGKQVYVEKPET